MQPPTRSDLLRLAKSLDHDVISLYLETARAGAETRESPIRFKNLLRQVAERLERRNGAEALLSRLRSSCEPRLTDHDFWQHQSEGLAVFCDEDRCEMFSLPLKPPTAAHVGRRFHIKPLLPVLDRSGAFHVLALSTHQCRLFRGDTTGIEEVEAEGLPESMADALRLDDLQQSLQFRTQRSAGSGEGHAMFHGQGGGEDDDPSRCCATCSVP